MSAHGSSHSFELLVDIIQKCYHFFLEIISVNKKAKTKVFKKTSRIRPINYLTNEENVGRAILECLQNNDPEGVMEIVGIYLEAIKRKRTIVYSSC
ncbi:MAG: hypothetical protein KR126chlam3_01172 [Chlamydiae bacterium]|nr:hypothetical protein [Chlamydiota bacterium]